MSASIINAVLGVEPRLYACEESTLWAIPSDTSFLLCGKKSYVLEMKWLIGFSFLLYRMADLVCVTVEIPTRPPLPFFLCSLFLLIFFHHLLTYYAWNLIDEYGHVVNVIVSSLTANKIGWRKDEIGLKKNVDVTFSSDYIGFRSLSLWYP